MSHPAEKTAARRQAREARRALDAATRALAATAVADRLLALPQVQAAGIVLAYSATAEELDLAETIERLRAGGATIAYPRIESPGVLSLRMVDDETELVEGRLGIREPDTEALRIEPSAIDVVFAPGVAFDAVGRRLGYGGGYYDRLIPSLSADCTVIGVAFDEQILMTVPADERDARVDLVVTPTGVLAG